MYRNHFPVFASHPELIYLDSAATTQKPQVVIDAITRYYTDGVANPDRGLYPLSIAASETVASARKTVSQFIAAPAEGEVIFTSGATAGINLVARGLANRLQAGDEIILSHLEHHSNLLPWQQLAEAKGLTLKFLPVDPETGEISIGELSTLLSDRTRVIALSLTSNVFGSTSPLGEVKKVLAEQGSSALFLIDASQAITHTPLSATELGADFIVFSGHKAYGPSGVGVLWGKHASLTLLESSVSGGGTVSKVTSEETVWKDLPENLEGGTLNVEGIIGMTTSLTWLQEVGRENISQHLHALMTDAREQLSTVPGITFISPESSTSIITFTIEGIHAHDIAQACADSGICIRAGQHCAGPLHETLNLSASCRVSFGLYNTPEDTTVLTRTLTDLVTAYRA